jgi:hypothetical protein
MVEYKDIDHAAHQRCLREAAAAARRALALFFFALGGSLKKVIQSRKWMNIFN